MKHRIIVFVVLLVALFCVGCGKSTQKATEGLEFTAKDGTYQVTGYHGTDVNVIIPDTYNDIPVTVIAEKAFANSEIQTVIIGANVEIIEESAFASASLLKEVTLPASLKEIGAKWTSRKDSGVFYKCVSLKKVSIANGNCLEVIGDATFAECTALAQFSIPDTVEYVGNYAFAECVQLKELVLSEKVEFVGALAFDDFSNDQKIIIKGATDGWMSKSQFNAFDWWSNCDALIVLDN